mgnify:CR=1 FL=1
MSDKPKINLKSLPTRCGPTSKVIFKSYNAAIFRAEEILKSESSRSNYFRAYKCEYCGFWHLTSKTYCRNI